VQFGILQATVMQQTAKVGQSWESPYCSDPNCKYCNELRQVHEKVKKGEWIPPEARVCRFITGVKR